MRIRVFLSLLLVFSNISTSHAIVPLLIPFAPAAARVVVGQFAAAGLATVINSATIKTLTIPQNNKALKVSFAASLAITAFALAAGYAMTSEIMCTYNGIQVSKTVAKSMAIADLPANNILDSWVDSASGNSQLYVLNTVSNVVYLRTTLSCGMSQVTQSADENMWLDYQVIDQPKTDKIVLDLQNFAISNPPDFDQIVELSDFAAQQSLMSYDTASGVVTVSSDGVGGVVVSGGSNPALTLDSSSNILVDGAASTTASSSTSTPASTADPVAPTGTANATGSDLGAVVSAINASKNQTKQSIDSLISSLSSGGSSTAAVVASTDAVKTSVDAVKAAVDNIQTDCDKFPDSLGCSALGTPDSAPLLANTIVDFSTGITPLDLGLGALSSVCPPDIPITVSGTTVYFSYDPTCQFISGMKPFVLAVAWLSAAMIFFGAVRGSSLV